MHNLRLFSQLQNCTAIWPVLYNSDWCVQFIQSYHNGWLEFNSTFDTCTILLHH